MSNQLTVEETITPASVEELYSACQQIADDPQVLNRFIHEINEAGFVGEERASRLIFLALVSRLLDEPVSIAVKGPSSAGKSHTTKQVLKFFPPKAFYALTAMSEKALAYTREPLAHRFLVIYEAEGANGKMASYFIRSLLSEGCIDHVTLVPVGGKEWEQKHLHVEGPTGLLTTTTLPSLHPENETRLISVPVNDTPEQTRRIVKALACGRSRAGIDYAPWHAFQNWLGAGPTEVLIPFAERLAEACFVGTVRVRRDFGKLLTLVKAHALIHRNSRDRTLDGAVVARIEDYRAVYSLVLDLMGEAAQSCVSTATRETVAAVAKLLDEGRCDVSVTHLAAELEIDKSSASRRVSAAIEGGYLVNGEDRKGHPWKITLGDPLPDDLPILPAPEDLAA
ncbi:MAG: hypothetical protein ABL967_01560 [Bryobacteraceae bacterium]